MPTIAAPTFTRDFRKYVGAFLRSFFDGNSHTFGGAPVLFPAVDVVFDRPQFGAALTKPTVVVEPFSPGTTKRHARNAGMLKEHRPLYKFTVVTNDPNRVWDVNANVMDLLEMVFNGAAPTLAANGIRTFHVGEPVTIPLDASQDYQVSQRIITFWITLTYGRAT